MRTEEGWEFDEAALVSAFAVGLPGKRTFFLGIGDKNNWVRIWLEKEHLQALTQGIRQLPSVLSQRHIRFSDEEESPTFPDGFPSGLPSVELDVIQVLLGYDEHRKATIAFVVERSGAKEKNQLKVYSTMTVAQLKRLGSQVKKVCAAGRPLCPICGGPINPSGHTCPEQN